MSPRRKLVLVVVPAALAIAVGAALVHGFVGSSSPKTAAHPPAVFSATGAAGTARAKAEPAPARSGAVRRRSGARLQRTEASLELRVKDTSAATTKATRIATALGGYAESVTYSSSSRSASSSCAFPRRTSRPRSRGSPGSARSSRRTCR